MKIRGKKIGRSAHDHVRDQARDLVAAYAPVTTSAEGRHCANPEDAPEDQIWTNSHQALSALLSALKTFAETGIFISEIDLRQFHVRETYRSMRDAGQNRATAMDQLMTKFHQSQSTTERAIREDRNKTEANKARAANAQEVGRAFARAWAERKKAD